jgi:hypothetical protein
VTDVNRSEARHAAGIVSAVISWVVALIVQCLTGDPINCNTGRASCRTTRKATTRATPNSSSSSRAAVHVQTEGTRRAASPVAPRWSTKSGVPGRRGDSTFCHFKIYVNNYTTQIHRRQASFFICCTDLAALGRSMLESICNLPPSTFIRSVGRLTCWRAPPKLP